jgi:hypothetical protein
MTTVPLSSKWNRSTDGFGKSLHRADAAPVLLLSKRRRTLKSHITGHSIVGRLRKVPFRNMSQASWSAHWDSHRNKSLKHELLDSPAILNF